MNSNSRHILYYLIQSMYSTSIVHWVLVWSKWCFHQSSVIIDSFCKKKSASGSVTYSNYWCPFLVLSLNVWSLSPVLIGSQSLIQISQIWEYTATVLWPDNTTSTTDIAKLQTALTNVWFDHIINCQICIHIRSIRKEGWNFASTTLIFIWHLIVLYMHKKTHTLISHHDCYNTNTTIWSRCYAGDLI